MGKRDNRFQVRVIHADTSDPTIPPEVEDRDFAKTILEMMYNLESDWNQGGWDQPPALGFVYERSRRQVGSTTLLYMQFSEIPTFKIAARNRERPWTAIVDLAETLHDLGDLVPAAPDNLVAIVFIVEAWMLDQNLDDPERAAEVDRVSRERKIHEHKDRVEVRTVNVVDKTGLRYGLMRERDGIIRALVGNPHNGVGGIGTSMVGDVHNALHFFMDTAQGKPMPSWDQWRELYDYESLVDEHRKRGGSDAG